jgi:hypothetical protein
MPSKSVTVRFVLNGSEKIEKAEKLCGPHLGQKFEHPRLFRFWILSLAAMLSELCDGRHSSNSYKAPRSIQLQPFKKEEVTTKDVCEELRRLLNTPLSPSEKEAHGMGHVYILRSKVGTSTQGGLKIGFSKYHPEHRAHEIAQCYAMPEVVSHTPLLPHAKRLESIIHMELQSVRKVHSCSRCNGNHREWFTISHGESREIVMRWSRWLLQQPYVDGKLTDGWKAYLAAKDFGAMDDNLSLADIWQTVIDDFPTVNLPVSESERIGEYLNQCHWEATCARFGIDKFETCDKCERRASIMSNLQTTTFLDIEEELEANAECFRKIKHLDEQHDGRENENTNRGCEGCKDFNFLDRSSPKSSNRKTIDPDEPYGNLAKNDTRLGSMFHPAMPSGYLLMPDFSPGRLSLLLRAQHEDERLARAELLELIKSLKDIKTGGRSVSDPVLGITESPLGDATLLPVLALKDLKYLDPPVTSWVGVTPTHSGFQYLQEAYKEGKWFGRTPKFQLPKAYRDAGIKSVPMAVPRSKASRITSETETSSDGRRYSTSDGDLDYIMQNQKGDGMSFLLSRGADMGSERFTFTQTITEDFKTALTQKIEEIKNGGYEKAQRELAKVLRHFGLDACYDIPDYGDVTDSDREKARSVVADSHAFPLKMPAKRKEASSYVETGISAKKAKQWLESL